MRPRSFIFGHEEAYAELQTEPNRNLTMHLYCITFMLHTYRDTVHALTYNLYEMLLLLNPGMNDFRFHAESQQ